MKKYTLAEYEEQLNHQVIHMDQAVCYNPEFCATRKMHDYPSRKLQLARAVYKNELPLTEYVGDLVFSSILSRQGERWQNFRENQEDCTDVMILCRKMLLDKGYQALAVEEFRRALAEGGGRLIHAHPWNLPQNADSETAIVLDDVTASACKSSEKALAFWCEKNGITFINPAVPVFTGFEYFAYGLVEEGTEHLAKMIKTIEETGAKDVMVLSAQLAWMLTTFADKLGLSKKFAVRYLPHELDRLSTDTPSYVYAGSFNLRYLCNSQILNALLPNTTEERDKRSIEFIPLLKGDRRVNQLTIWQKPLSAEYMLYGMKKEIIYAIREDALLDIKKADAEQIIVFEPTAMPVLKEAFPEKKICFYLDLLKDGLENS